MFLYQVLLSLHRSLSIPCIVPSGHLTLKDQTPERDSKEHTGVYTTSMVGWGGGTEEDSLFLAAAHSQKHSS